MVAERDELQKKTFPCLTGPYSSTEVRPIDLRWGIRNENTIGAQLIDLCLDSVARSAVFIGMIGQRYGGVIPDQILEPVLRNREYLKHGTSLTECEIRAAFALRETGEGPERLIFGFRNDDWTFPDERIRLLLPQPYQNCSPDEFSDTDPNLIQKLSELKEFIGSQDCIVFEYRNAEECAERVRRELESILPAIKFRRTNRASSGVVNRAALSQIRDWRSGKRSWFANLASRMVLSGEIGIGKTHTIADFLAENGDDDILCLFADDFSTMDDALSWLESELHRRGHECVRDGRPIRRRIFERIIAFTNEQSAFLILDGLEGLTENPDLSWLPDSQASVLVTVGNNSKWQREFRQRGFTISEFPSLSEKESLQLAKNLLARYGKQEWPSIREVIIKQGIRSPQMLHTLIGGLHREVYETVDHAVADYADFTTVSKLIARSWGRLVEDLEHTSTEGAVRHILHYVSIDRSGIHPHDLDRLLRATTQWNSSIAMANLRPSLKEEDGVIRFSSEAAFEAARKHLNPTPEELRLRWSELGEFFSNRDDVPLSRHWKALFRLGQRSGEWSWSLDLIRRHSEEIFRNYSADVAFLLAQVTKVNCIQDFDELFLSAPVETVSLAAHLGHHSFVDQMIDELSPNDYRSTVLRVAPWLIDEGDAPKARSYLMNLRPDEISASHRLAAYQLLSHLEVIESHWRTAGRLLDICEEQTSDDDPLSLPRCWIALFQTRIEFGTTEQLPTQRLINLRQAFEQHRDQRGVAWSALWLFDCYQRMGDFTNAEATAETLIESRDDVGHYRIQRLASLRLATMYVRNDMKLDMASRLLNHCDQTTQNHPEVSKCKAEISKLRCEILRRLGSH